MSAPVTCLPAKSPIRTPLPLSFIKSCLPPSLASIHSFPSEAEVTQILEGSSVKPVCFLLLTVTGHLRKFRTSHVPGFLNQTPHLNKIPQTIHARVVARCSGPPTWTGANPMQIASGPLFELVPVSQPTTDMRE